MGQSPSSIGNMSRQRRSFRFMRRSKLNKSNLSHTFSMPPSDEYPELVNINLASEEQLMTLPGVTRPLARSIVQHRQLIGRFKRVDDLALVSGIGAEKLEAMRGEICTSRKLLSRASSCTYSLDSERTTVDGSQRLCSVNSASVFQLQCVPGLNQEIAANIVDHRHKKGPFKSLDDLIKVRGMDIVRLSTVKPHLSLQSRKCESTLQLSNGTFHSEWSAEPAANSTLVNGSSRPRTPHRKSSSMPTKFPMTLPNGFATAPVNDILDLLSAYSHRPIVEEDFRYERNGFKCCRLASWNLHQLGLDKINNPGVREVVCRTILENKISLLAIQDILDEMALRIICDELNSPVLRRIREWKCNSQRWRYCVSGDGSSKGLGFLYDSSQKDISIDSFDIDQLLQNDKNGSRKKLMEELCKVSENANNFTVSTQVFKLCAQELVVLNVWCRGRLSLEESDSIQQGFTAAEHAGVPIAILGDFHHLDNIHSLTSKCEPVISEGINTALELNGSGRCSILCPRAPDRSGFNGVWGVVRSGLSHLAIPRGWSWGGPASPYCPLWAEYKLAD